MRIDSVPPPRAPRSTRAIWRQRVAAALLYQTLLDGA